MRARVRGIRQDRVALRWRPFGRRAAPGRFGVRRGTGGGTCGHAVGQRPRLRAAARGRRAAGARLLPGRSASRQFGARGAHRASGGRGRTSGSTTTSAARILIGAGQVPADGGGHRLLLPAGLVRLARARSPGSARRLESLFAGRLPRRGRAATQTERAEASAARAAASEAQHLSVFTGARGRPARRAGVPAAAADRPGSPNALDGYTS